MDKWELAKIRAAKEQPRQAINNLTRHALPYAEPFRQQQSPLFTLLPLDCRLLIWELVLQVPQTRIERWRPSDYGFVYAGTRESELDCECFPYRMTTGGWEKKEGMPLNLLLCCRQIYLEALSTLYSTTLVFETPLDLYNFQLCVSPEGLASVKRLVLAPGHLDKPGYNPFFMNREGREQPHCSLDDWINALLGLEKMRQLHSLDILLGHRHEQTPALEQRPWSKDQESLMAEKRHRKLFDLFGALDVRKFTLHLTWYPADIMSQRAWPFEIKLHTMRQMNHVIDLELPMMADQELYDWSRDDRCWTNSLKGLENI